MEDKEQWHCFKINEEGVSNTACFNLAGVKVFSSVILQPNNNYIYYVQKKFLPYFNVESKAS